MKYAIPQLRKFKMPLRETSEIDFSQELNGFEDVLSSSKALVDETLSQISEDTYNLKASIKITLTLQSAISLKEVPYAIDTVLDIEYTTNKGTEDSDAIVIENNTIDTYDAILTEILCQKPMTVTLDGEEFIDEAPEDDTEKINPAFQGLADLLKK
jgi:uncharacterized metal-binding protein YceD (DUF177 family)